MDYRERLTNNANDFDGIVMAMLTEIESLRARLKEKDETLQELQNKLAEAEKEISRYKWLRYGGITPELRTYIDAAIQQAKRGEG